MKSAFDTKTICCLAIGFVLQITPIVYATKATGQPVSEFTQMMMMAVRVAGMATFIPGVGFLAQNKGRSVFLGALGLFSLIGLAIVMVLPAAKPAD